MMLQFGLIAFRFAYGRTRKTSFLWFLEFRACPRAPKPAISVFWDPRPQRIKKKNNSFLTYAVSEIQQFEILGKNGRRIVPTICLFSWNYWMQDHYLTENIKFNFGKSLELWDFETKKRRNQETLKPSNFEAKKPRNQDTSKSRNRGTPKPIIVELFLR